MFGILNLGWWDGSVLLGADFGNLMSEFVFALPHFFCSLNQVKNLDKFILKTAEKP